MARSLSSRPRFAQTVQWLAILLLSLLAACESEQQRIDEHMARAAGWEAKGKPTSALIEYRNALKLDPHSGELNFRIGRALVGLDRIKESLFYFGEVLRLEPERSDAALVMAKLLLFEDPERAGELVEGVLEHDPGVALAYVRRSELALARSDPEAALEAAIRASELAPDDPDSHRQLGVVHQARIRERQLRQLEPDDALFEAALGAYDRVIELRGDAPTWHAQLIRARIYASWAGHRGQAIEAYREALQNASRHGARARLDAARVALSYARSSGDASLERDSLEHIVEADPSQYAAWENLARMAQAQDASGAAVFQRLLRSRPRDLQAQMSWVHFLLEQGRGDDAVRHLRGVIEGGIDPPGSLAELARTLYRLGRMEEASDVVDRLVEEHPGHPRTALASAERALRDGRLDDAVSELHVLLGSTESRDAERLLALAESQRGNFEAALAATDRAIAQASGSSGELHRLKAALQQHALDCEGALETLRLMVKRKVPLGTSGALTRSRCLYQMGREERAGRILEQLLARSTPPIPAILEFSRRAGVEQPERLRGYLEEALTRAPDHPALLLALTVVDLFDGNAQTAVERLDAVIASAQAPPDPRLLLVRARAHLGADQPIEAEADALLAFDRDPLLPGVLPFLVALYGSQNRLIETIGPLEESRRAKQLGPAGHALLGRLYLERGETLAAREVLEHSLASGLSNADTQNDLAYLLASEGKDLERALELAIQARRLLDDDPSAADTLGYVYLRRGLPSAAAVQFREAIDLAEARRKPRATYHFHRGLAEQQRGRDADAAEAFERALALDPSFPEAESARQSLETLRAVKKQAGAAGPAAG